MIKHKCLRCIWHWNSGLTSNEQKSHGHLRPSRNSFFCIERALVFRVSPSKMRANYPKCAQKCVKCASNYPKCVKKAWQMRDPTQKDEMCFWVSKDQTMLKWIIFTFGNSQGRGRWLHLSPPYGQPDRIKTVFYDFPQQKKSDLGGGGGMVDASRDLLVILCCHGCKDCSMAQTVPSKIIKRIIKSSLTSFSMSDYRNIAYAARHHLVTLGNKMWAKTLGQQELGQQATFSKWSCAAHRAEVVTKWLTIGHFVKCD